MMPSGSDHDQEGHNLPVQARPGVPRWVKVFALIALAVVVVLAAVMLLGGEHGPGMHSSALGNPYKGVPVSAESILA